MKLWALLSAFIFSTSAFAISVHVSGMNPGGQIICQSVGDDGRIDLVANHLTLSVNGNNLVFAAEFSSNVCSYDPAQSMGRWSARKFYDPIVNPGFSEQPGTLYLDQQNFSITDENDKLWGQIETQNVLTQRVAFSLPLNSFLSAAEMQQIEAGQNVQRQLLLFASGIATFKTGADSVVLGTRNTGMFYLTFTLSK